MPRYNFADISDFEFEELCRDLLQEEVGLSLELFAPGRDQGIDIRYVGSGSGSQHDLIGQCKRWAEDTFARLLRHLSQDELPKINELAPKRYILMTSVGLTVGQKKQIVAALDPWIQSPGDVMGRDDISGLLGRHPEVERRHIKLWLTSTEVLDALLNSDIANRSEDALERAKRQLRLWVPNPSFNRAREILAANHVCIISGPPGIGKTMLADVLLADYASEGFQPVVISNDIEEANRAWRRDIRQVFYYDDFLGHVRYGELHLRKNEESRLANFWALVRKSTNKRFILTTREYILAEATMRYERLSDRDITPIKSIVSLGDYTNLMRGRILYNHLFFSDIPPELKTALIPEKRYRDVIRHKNYSPRVIEYAVCLPDVAGLSPNDFVCNIFDTLDDPARVWGRIFDNLSDMARRVLLAVASLPTMTFLDDVRDVVMNLWPTDFDTSKFNNAVGVVEGTFVDLNEAHPGAGKSERTVEIRNPSVRDYLWGRLESDGFEAAKLLQGAIFFEQCVMLYEGRNHTSFVASGRFRSIAEGTPAQAVVHPKEIATRAIELITSPSPVPRRIRDDHSEYYEREPVSLERRTAFLMSMLADNPRNQEVTISVLSALEVVIKEWEIGRGSPNMAVQILGLATQDRVVLHENVVEKVKRTVFSLITGSLDSREDFQALVALADLDTDLFQHPNRSLETWAVEFEDFLDGERDWLLEDLDDPDWIEAEMDEIRSVARALNVDISELEPLVEEHVDTLRSSFEPDDYEDMREAYFDSEDGPDEESEDAKIDALFQSL